MRNVDVFGTGSAGCVDEERRRAPWLQRAKTWLDVRAVRGCCQDTYRWASKVEMIRSIRIAGPQAL